MQCVALSECKYNVANRGDGCIFDTKVVFFTIVKKESINEIFFALVRFSIGSEQVFPYSLSGELWNALFDIAKRQTLVGILFAGIEQLPKEQRPPKELLMQWVLLTERIKNANSKLNIVAARVAKNFKEAGFDSVLLKGQAVALYYPKPQLRTPGDIDIWLNGSRRDIIRYVRRFVSGAAPVYHHIEFNISKEADIEVHFTPSWLNSTFTNIKLQRFFRENGAESFANLVTLEGADNGIAIATKAFNRVYLLVHIYRHLFSEGIGLRQLLDYYWLLKQGCSDREREAAMLTLQQLKMERFAGATMYVLQQVFGLTKEYMLTAPLKDEGEFLLQEIMLSGNFGMYDARNNGIQSKNALVRFAKRVARNWRFIRMYPSEVMWTPVFKMWHAVWRYWYSIFD